MNTPPFLLGSHRIVSCRARGVKRACNKDKVQGGLRMPQAHKLELLMCFLSLTTYTALGKVKGITKVRLSQRTPQHTHTHTKAHTRTHTHFTPYFQALSPQASPRLLVPCTHRLCQAPVTSIPFALLSFLTMVLGTGNRKTMFLFGHR